MLVVVIEVAVEFETSKGVMILKGNLRKDLVASGYYHGTCTFTTTQLGPRCASAMRGIKTKTLCIDNHIFVPSFTIERTVLCSSLCIISSCCGVIGNAVVQIVKSLH